MDKKQQGKQRKSNIWLIPFSCSEDNVHSDLPSKRTARPYIPMNPLFKVPIIYKLVDKHPIKWSRVMLKTYI